MSEIKEDTILKRKPGRPRKKPAKTATQRNGIAVKPQNTDNIVELQYDNPTNFKKICVYLKNENCENLRFIWTKKGLTLNTKSFRDTNDINIVLDGSRMNAYYCEPQRFVVGVNFVNLEIILQKLDKTYETITFLIQHKSQNKSMTIILQNDVNIPEYFNVDMVIDPMLCDDEKIQITIANPDTYALEFKLPGRYFRKMIADTRQFGNEWTIEKFGENNLEFKYASENKQVQARLIPQNIKELELVSRLKSDELFSVSIYTDSIRPASSSHLAEYITIRASKKANLWLHAELDSQAIIVNIYIKPVDHRVASTK